RVAQIVDANARNACALYQPIEITLQVVGVNRRAAGRRKDEVVIVPRFPRGKTAFVLTILVFAQGIKNLLLDWNVAPTAFGLGRFDIRCAVQPPDGLADAQNTALPIDIAPAQAQHLASTHPR